MGTIAKWVLILLIAGTAAQIGCVTPRTENTQDQTIKTARFTHSGDQLYYEVAGRGCPVILIGGGGGMDLRQWDLQFESFRTGYQVVRWDPRGTGRTGAPSTPYSDREDLAALMDHLEIERAVVVGISSAGTVALEFSLVYPDRVAGVVAGSPFLAGFDHTEEFKQRLARLAAAAQTDATTFVDAMLADPHFAPAPDKPEVRDKIRQLMTENYGIQFDPALPQPLDPPLIGRLGEIHSPTLLLTGTLEHPDVLRRTDFVQGNIDGSELEMIERAGHMVNLEQPTVFNDAVRRFIQSLDCASQ